MLPRKSQRSSNCSACERGNQIRYHGYCEFQATKKVYTPLQYFKCMVSDFLTDKVLWFDFGPRKKLSESDFCKTFNHLKFESILQYVAFPHVDLEMDESNSASESRGRVRRNPMVVFFDWLRNDERGVKRIIKVIVDDLDEVSHTDEAIEQALTGFVSEVSSFKDRHH